MSGNEAAFPQSYPDDPTRPVWADNTLSRGLTKREWLAGMALQALLTNDNFHVDQHELSVARDALRYTDALLSVMEKE